MELGQACIEQLRTAYASRIVVVILHRVRNPSPRVRYFTSSSDPDQDATRAPAICSVSRAGRHHSCMRLLLIDRRGTPPYQVRDAHLVGRGRHPISMGGQRRTKRCGVREVGAFDRLSDFVTATHGSRLGLCGPFVLVAATGVVLRSWLEGCSSVLQLSTKSSFVKPCFTALVSHGQFGCSSRPLRVAHLALGRSSGAEATITAPSSLLAKVADARGRSCEQKTTKRRKQE
jgi:hypothetical protein